MKTRNLFITPLFIFTLFISACNTGLESEEVASEGVTSPDSISSSPVEQYINASDSFKAAVASQPASQTNAQTSEGINLPALNPKHGQPGHNCDLEVGAPLSSAPSKGAASTQPANTVSINNSKPATGTSSAGLNPPHGQPGHKCEIEVGAPLNSAPTASPAISTSGSGSTPALPAANASGAKLNPAHGQPGHDCAVPVGQPLKN